MNSTNQITAKYMNGIVTKLYITSNQLDYRIKKWIQPIELQQNTWMGWPLISSHKVVHNIQPIKLQENEWIQPIKLQQNTWMGWPLTSSHQVVHNMPGTKIL